MNKWRLVAALTVVVGLFWALAPAKPPRLRALDVAQLSGRVDLARSVAVLEDPDGKMTIADARAAASGGRFRQSDASEVSLGLSFSALWLRFQATNPSATQVQWVLGVEESSLDDVRVFVLRPDGSVETHVGGDRLPFSARELKSPSFAYYLDVPAHEQATVFLRVRSQDPMRVPLAAYAPAAWSAQQERENIGAWLFYGGLLAIAFYYISVAVTVWQLEHVWCTCVALSMLGVQASIFGHATQYWFPNDPALANRCLPVTVALSLLGIALFARGALSRLAAPPLVDNYARKAVGAAMLVLVWALTAPLSVAQRGIGLVLLLVCGVGPVLLRVIDARRFPELKLLAYCFLALIVTVPIGVFRFAGYLPPHPFFDWALRAGMFAYGGIMSLGLAAWVKWMRERLSNLNKELSDNVSNLQVALTRAEEASERAERATMAKDDFMATMSHELRTPLNAIINIPQGMIGDFQTVRAAHCSTCKADYLLDEGEQVTADTVCEECQGKGTLIPGTKVLFNGDAARTLHFLKKIERSGHHLLQMVNGVLDYSKLEAGRFQLSLEPADLEALCKEVVDQMSDLGVGRNIQLVYTRLTEVPQMTFDQLRIKQVLINLVANALKFSEPNSVVGIELSRDGDAAVIEVQDAGIGIAEENHERIFAGFEQVHKGDTRKYGGTGLGLSISRSLVRMHGGELSVRSELGKGATFIVRLPRLPHLGSQVGTSELKVFTQRSNVTATRRNSLA